MEGEHSGGNPVPFDEGEANIPESHYQLLIRAAENQLAPGEQYALDELLEAHPDYRELLEELCDTWRALDAWEAPSAPRRAEAEFVAVVRRGAARSRRAAGWRWAVPLAVAASLGAGAVSLLPQVIQQSAAGGALSAEAAGPRQLVLDGFEPAVQPWRPGRAQNVGALDNPSLSAQDHDERLAGWDRRHAARSVGIVVPESEAGDEQTSSSLRFIGSEAEAHDPRTHYLSPQAVFVRSDSSL